MNDDPLPSAGAWAQAVERISVSNVPEGAINLNLEGRAPVSPLQGFGPMWQKSFRIRLRGLDKSPAEVMALWKAEFPRFQPPGNNFFPPLAGVQPGEIIFIDSAVSAMPGILPAVPIASGVRVIFADDESFTIMTPQGFPEAGWNTFSAFSEDGSTWAQVQTMARTADPIYEFGFRFMGGARFQDETWHHVLTSLASHLGVDGEWVQARKVCVDPRLQWRAAGNVRHNAMLHSIVSMPGWALRKLLGRGREQKKEW
jgi:hypothetical protein